MTVISSSNDHISICICTYKRPDMLELLLSRLAQIETHNLFTYEIVVVDNDANQSACPAVCKTKQSSPVRINYFVEPEQNIALARNKAVDNAQGNFIAFLDDDELPVRQWLFNLYQSIRSYNCDGVLGPVRPYYPEGCPQWLIKSRLCERPEHKTGTILNWGQTRTGNVLFDKRIFDEDSSHRFGREFGRSGGEDIEFFKKMVEAGKTFIWCNEAPVYETVFPERWEKRFYSERYLRIGGLVGEKIRKRESMAVGLYALIKSALWIVSMSFGYPLARLAGEHLAMKAVTKIMYNTGLISGYAGRVIIRNRKE